MGTVTVAMSRHGNDFGPEANPHRSKRPITIQGPYHYIQRRVNPTSQFEQGDRVWRKTWLRDLNLTARDRAYNTYENPQYYKATNHLLRRIWQWPMNQFEKVLKANLPVERAYYIRYTTRSSCNCTPSAASAPTTSCT